MPVTHHRNYHLGKLHIKDVDNKDIVADNGSKTNCSTIKFTYDHPVDPESKEIKTVNSAAKFTICNTRFPQGLQCDIVTKKVKDEKTGKDEEKTWRSYKVRGVFEMYDGLCTECLVDKEEVEEREETFTEKENCPGCLKLRKEAAEVAECSMHSKCSGFVSTWQKIGYVKAKKNIIERNDEDLFVFLKNAKLYRDPESDSEVIGEIPEGSKLASIGEKEGEFRPFAMPTETEISFKIKKNKLEAIKDVPIHKDQSEHSAVVGHIPAGTKLKIKDTLRVNDCDVYSIETEGTVGFFEKVRRDVCRLVIENRTRFPKLAINDYDQLLTVSSTKVAPHFPKKEGVYLEGKNPMMYFPVDFYDQKMDKFREADGSVVEEKVLANSSFAGIPEVSLSATLIGADKLTLKFYIKCCAITDVSEKKEYVPQGEVREELKRDEANTSRVSRKIKAMAKSAPQPKYTTEAPVNESTEELQTTEGGEEGNISMLDAVSGGPTVMASTKLAGMDALDQDSESDSDDADFS